MKVSSSRSRRTSGFGGTQGSRNDSAITGHAVFKDNLRMAQAESLQEDLERLVPQLDEAAAALADARTLRNFNRYRDLVRQFLSRIVSESHQVKELSAFSGGRHKIMVVVEKVNDALDQLGREVMDAHAGSIRLLQIVDEIRGLLVDLYT